MKYPSNISEIYGLEPDYMGFIFYSKSKRNVGDDLDEKLLASLNELSKVGVFVNEGFDFIKQKADAFGFAYIQLHGEEPPELCKRLKESGLGVIKVFSVDENFDFNTTEEYKPFADFFLFDTKSESYGGTGKRFNWDVLKKYDNQVPFFLSGGIDLEQAEEIKKLEGLNIHAIDINSCFEKEPGMKEVEKVRKFISLFKK